LEFARTPGWAVRALFPIVGRPKAVADLGCGDGAIGAEFRKHLGYGAIIAGVEIDPARAASAQALQVHDGERWTPVYDAKTVRVGDVVEGYSPPLIHGYFDLVVSNPPFSLAAEFLQEAARVVRPGGLIAFLLRANWLVPAVRSEVRNGLFSPTYGHLKADLHFLERRPSFRKSTKGNSTDSADYAWHVWGLGRGGRYSVLQCEPAERRRAKKDTADVMEVAGGHVPKDAL
jgi:SAM-dependent methyltransferase